jgi:DNA-binding transcriptional regulator YiaG
MFLIEMQTMTPAEFKAIREALGMSQSLFARALAAVNPAVAAPNYQRIYEWENGFRPLPVQWIMRANVLKKKRRAS